MKSTSTNLTRVNILVFMSGNNNSPSFREEVAKAAGVSTGTLSMALSGKGKIKASTRERVRRIAEEMGYRPNAAASLLASRRGQVSGKLSIAHISSFPDAQRRFNQVAEKLGVQGVQVDPGDFHHPREMLRMLWSRGTDGIYLSSHHFSWTAAEMHKLDWSPFSVVKFGRVHEYLPFHLVRHDAFVYMRETIWQVMEKGKNRVGVLLIHSGSKVDDEARLGAVMAAKHHWKKQGREITWRYWKKENVLDPDPQALRWLEKFRPDAVIGTVWPLWYPLNQAGWRFPEDAGYAAVLTPGDESPAPDYIDGCLIQSLELLERAVKFQMEMIGRNERGWAEHPVELVVEPRWYEGKTLEI